MFPLQSSRQRAREPEIPNSLIDSTPTQESNRQQQRPSQGTEAAGKQFTTETHDAFGREQDIAGSCGGPAIQPTITRDPRAWPFRFTRNNQLRIAGAGRSVPNNGCTPPAPPSPSHRTMAFVVTPAARNQHNIQPSPHLGQKRQRSWRSILLFSRMGCVAGMTGFIPPRSVRKREPPDHP